MQQLLVPSVPCHQEVTARDAALHEWGRRDGAAVLGVCCWGAGAQKRVHCRDLSLESIYFEMRWHTKSKFKIKAGECSVPRGAGARSHWMASLFHMDQSC